MKIAIIGSGNVGGTLGGRWAKKGHEVTFGSRDPKSEKIQNLIKSIGGKAKAATVKEAVSDSHIVVLATPWPATEGIVKEAGDLKNKVVIDCTNPMQKDLSGLAVDPKTSAAEMISEWSKGAYVVKAFNTTGSKNMADPLYGDQKISMMICGDDSAAKKTVTELADELDFDVVDAGGLKVARLLEPMALLWVNLSYLQKLGPNVGFKLLRR